MLVIRDSRKMASRDFGHPILLRKTPRLAPAVQAINIIPISKYRDNNSFISSRQHPSVARAIVLEGFVGELVRFGRTTSSLSKHLVSLFYQCNNYIGNVFEMLYNDL